MASLYKLWFKTKDTINISVILEGDNMEEVLQEGKRLQSDYGQLYLIDNIYSNTSKKKTIQRRLT